MINERGRGGRSTYSHRIHNSPRHFTPRPVALDLAEWLEWPSASSEHIYVCRRYRLDQSCGSFQATSIRRTNDTRANPAFPPQSQAGLRKIPHRPSVIRCNGFEMTPFRPRGIIMILCESRVRAIMTAQLVHMKGSGPPFQPQARNEAFRSPCHISLTRNRLRTEPVHLSANH